MFKPIMKIATAVALGLVVHSVAYCQSKWEFGEIYSAPPPNGAIQFVVLVFNGFTAELPVLAGQTLVASDGTTENRFTFASNVTHYFSDSGFDTGPCDSFMGDGCWSYVLVATQQFAALNLVKPDFVVPNGFLFVSNGSVRLGASESHYGTLPADGENARWGGSVLGGETINNLGESYVFMPEGINPIVEYYNGLDDYFLTTYPWEIAFLDSGFYPEYQRTGNTLLAWTSPFSVGASPPPNLTKVCRISLGDSHFYSISESECAGAAQYPGSIFESHAAFFATLPNTETGACPAGQAGVFRSWNTRGSGHRYTTDPLIRDLTPGAYIPEGYGGDDDHYPVAMCVGGKGQ